MIGRGRINQIGRRASARVGVWLVLLALFSQALALAVPPMGAPGDARQAARELTALLGPNVVICSQGDNPGAPSPPSTCDDRCPICQAAAGAFVFVAPDLPVHASPVPRFFSALAFPATPRAPPPGPVLIAFARGPPSTI